VRNTGSKQRSLFVYTFGHKPRQHVARQDRLLSPPWLAWLYAGQLGQLGHNIGGEDRGWWVLRVARQKNARLQKHHWIPLFSKFPGERRPLAVCCEAENWKCWLMLLAQKTAADCKLKHACAASRHWQRVVATIFDEPHSPQLACATPLLISRTSLTGRHPVSWQTKAFHLDGRDRRGSLKIHNTDQLGPIAPCPAGGLPMGFPNVGFCKLPSPRTSSWFSDIRGLHDSLALFGKRGER
jgi:hypothetical protein